MKQRRCWCDVPLWQKTGLVLLAIGQLGLLWYGLWDLRQRGDHELVGSRQQWSLLMFLNYIGPLAYFFYGRRRA